MARISTYEKDQVVNPTDKVIGTDGLTGDTFNYSVEALATFISGATTYIHDQLQTSATWLIQHDLERFPSIEVVDSAGTVVVGGIQYVDENNVTITFSSPFTGKAYLN